MSSTKFSGTTPYEIAEQYAKGDINREELINQLSRWEYATKPGTDGHGSILVDPRGTFDDVAEAYLHDLIDADAYEAILYRVTLIHRSNDN